MGTFVIIVQFILAISILIILHELGHFIPARIFKTRVEKFYLFFNPWFSLFKFKKGETEYGIGWLPLGGYVKISGMIDESMDTDQMKKPPQPWEFRSKPAWQRLIIMIGGVTVNLILAVCIYAMIAFVWGKDYVKNEDYYLGVEVLADELKGPDYFMNGDKILAIDGEKIDDFNDISKKVLINQSKNFTIKRGDEIKEITISEEAIDYMLKNETPIFFPQIPSVIDTVLPNSIAANIGLKKGDVIERLNNKDVVVFKEFKKELESLKEQQRDTFELLVRRNETIVALEGVFDTSYKLGFILPNELNKMFKSTHISYTFAQSIPEGFRLGYSTLKNYVKQFRLIFTKKEAAKKVGGFGSIAKLFKPVWIWKDFWSITAFISIALAFINILPIPALDGGHVMFLIYEMIAGRPPSDKFMERAQLFGFIVILLLFFLSNGNDVYRSWIK